VWDAQKRVGDATENNGRKEGDLPFGGGNGVWKEVKPAVKGTNVGVQTEGRIKRGHPNWGKDSIR